MGQCHTLGGIEIPAELFWEDEFDWSPSVGAVEWGLTGAAIIDVAAKQSGRPITLSGDADRGWIARSVVEALYALASNPGTPRVLTLADGRSFDVVFSPAEKPITATRLGYNAVPSSDWFYKAVTLRLMEI